MCFNDSFVYFRMTSTNVNVGLADGRNSSRILKPPGGGHTDIFGAVHQEQEIRTKHTYSKTEISECFASNVENTNGKVMTKENEKPDNIEVQPIQPEVDEKPATDENLKPAEEQKTAPAARVRVPPGGFSSGFW